MIIIAIVALIAGLIISFRPNIDSSLLIQQQSSSKGLNPSTFCGSGIASSNKYIKEFVIPSQCSQPLAIIADHDGSIWFAESQSRKIGKFDPKTEKFVEYALPPTSILSNFTTSGIWSMDFDRNGDLWFTDVGANSIWRFSKDNQGFEGYKIPTANSFPLSIIIDNSGKVWFTEAFGKKIGMLDPSSHNAPSQVVEFEVPLRPEILGGITHDNDGNLWFTMLNPANGYVVKYDTTSNIFTSYTTPKGISSPVGIVIDEQGNLWVSDHGTSIFLMLDPKNNATKQYVTSLPLKKTSIGTGGQPSSLPYWNAFDSKGRLWFNEHQGNMIAVFDPVAQTLAEYFVPSQNPAWGACESYNEPCGIANALRFAIAPDGKIWFTEWSESKIGVLDPNIFLPISLTVDDDSIEVENGKAKKLGVRVQALEPLRSDPEIHLSGTFTPSGDMWRINTAFSSNKLEFNNTTEEDVSLTLNPSKQLPPGRYSLTIGASYEDIVYSKAVELIVKESYSPIGIRTQARSETFSAFENGWVMIDKYRYNTNDTVTVSGGFFSDYIDKEPVNIKLYLPDDSEYISSFATRYTNAKFGTYLDLSEIPTKLYGTYRIEVNYGEQRATLFFEIVDPKEETDSKQFSFSERISYNPAFYCNKYAFTDFVQSGERINALVNNNKIAMVVDSVTKLEPEDATGKDKVKILLKPIDIESKAQIAVTHFIVKVMRDDLEVWNSGLLHSHCGNVDVLLKSDSISINQGSLTISGPFSMDIGTTAHFLLNVYPDSFTGPNFTERGNYEIEVQLVWIELRPLPTQIPARYNFEVT